VQVGPQLSLLFAAQDKGEISYSSSGGIKSGEEDVKEDYKSDFGVCAGLGADFKNGLLLAARFNYGLADIENNAFRQQIRNQAGLGGLHNRVLEVSVGYVFGSK
jgi:hypothetical protein